MKKTLIFLLMFMFVSSSGYAAWGDPGKESKLQKDSYEKLINKNLELRNEVDSLIKEQEQLREIYKVLLEKVKTLQRDNALSVKDKESAARGSVEARQTIERMKKELADANAKIATMEALIATGNAETKKSTNVFYEKNISHLKNSLKTSEEKYKEAVAQKDKIEKELKNIKDKISAQESESDKLSSQMKEQYTKVDTQAQKIDELSLKLKAALTAQEASGKALEEMKVSLKKKDEELNAQYEKVEASEEALKANQKAINDYTDQFKDESAKIAKLKEELTASGAALKKQEKEGEDLRLANKAQEERIKSLEKNILANNATIKEQAEKFKGPSAGIDALESQLKKANESLKAAQIELKSKDEEAKKLAQVFDMNALKKKYPDVFDQNDEAEEFKNSPPAKRVKKAVDRVTAQRNAKNAQAQDLDRLIAKAREQEKELKSEVSSYDAKIKESKDAIVQVNADMKNDAERAAAEQDRIRELEDSLDKLSAQQKGFEAKLEASPQKALQIEESLKKLAANLPKDSAPGFKTDEMKSLESQLEKTRDEEADLKEKVKSVENKIADLKETITTSRDKSKKELASKTAAAKQKKNKIGKEIMSAEAKKKNLKKEFQHIMKKIRLLGQMKESVLADVKYRDEEISDLKKIIAREMIQISAAEAADKTGAKPQKASAPGLAGEAQNILSTMHEQIDALKARNAELEKLLQSTKGAELEAKRKADAEKALEQDTLRKTNKERLDMHYNLGVVYDKNGMYKDAEREYLKCLDIDPKDAGVHYNLGLLYDDKLNKNNKAMWHYKKYLQFVPKGNDTYKVRQWLTDIELESRLGAEAR